MKSEKQHDLKSIIERYERAHFIVTRRVTAKVKEKLPDALTIDQCSILRHLKVDPNLTSTELSDVFGVGKSTITAMVTRLVDKGWVERKYSTEDRRIFYLSLTDSGSDMIDSVGQEVYNILAPYLGHFEVGEGLKFVEVFEKMAVLLQESHDIQVKEGE